MRSSMSEDPAFCKCNSGSQAVKRTSKLPVNQQMLKQVFCFALRAVQYGADRSCCQECHWALRLPVVVDDILTADVADDLLQPPRSPFTSSLEGSVACILQDILFADALASALLICSRNVMSKCLPVPAGFAAKAAKGGKAPATTAANAGSETPSSSSEAKPDVDYPDWLSDLTKPGKTLGELRRTPEDERDMADVSQERCTRHTLHDCLPLR